MSEPIVFYVHDTMFVISPSKLVMLVTIALGLLGGIVFVVWHLLAKD